MSTTTPNKYGIKLVKRTTQTRPETFASLGESDSSKVLASAKKVIGEHREVLKALAKR